MQHYGDKAVNGSANNFEVVGNITLWVRLVMHRDSANLLPALKDHKWGRDPRTHHGNGSFTLR
jgi:hypothetical protein